MGAADIVPGVSGGTMALITGIYQRLLAALGNIPAAVLTLVRERSLVRAWQTMDATFLLLLLGGILFSIVTLAHGIGALLDDHPMLVRAFFSGLIIGAVIHVGRQVPHWTLAAALGLAADLDAVERYYPYDRPVSPDDADALDPRPVEAAIADYDLLATGGTDAHEEALAVDGLPQAAWERVRERLPEPVELA
mgnify:CR=1 FL=1